MSADLLASSTFPAVLDPVLSAEFGVDTPILQDSAGATNFGEVASNDSTAVIAWGDNRDGDYEIWFSRAKEGGELLDVGGIQLTDNSVADTVPRVAVAESRALVVWLHAGTSTELHGALIDLGDGSVIRSGLLTTTDANTELGVASDGTNFLVAAKSMRVWRVSGTTGLLDSSPVTIVPSGHSAQSDIQFADGRYYVAATSRLLDGSDDVFLIRIRDDGTGDPVVESETTVFADTVEKAFRPRLAVGESTLLASWMYYVSGQPDRAFVAQRLRFDGTLVGERITLADMTGTGIADTAEAVGVGNDGYLVTWPGAPVPVYPMHRIWMATVDSAGVLSASTDLGVDTNGCVAPSLARIGSEYVSVYKCMSSGNELLLQPVDSAGTELTVD
ncbi:MAG: hypothetical protein AAFY60_18200, partial [Myxococcota bacterium]